MKKDKYYEDEGMIIKPLESPKGTIFKLVTNFFKNNENPFCTLNNNFQGIKPFPKTEKPDCVPYPQKKY
jgi:hypothetical protein